MLLLHEVQDVGTHSEPEGVRVKLLETCPNTQVDSTLRRF